LDALGSESKTVGTASAFAHFEDFQGKL